MLTPASCQLPAWLRLSSAGLWSLARPRCFQHDRMSVLSRIREAGILDGHVGWGRGVLSILLLLPLRVVWVTTSALLCHLSPAEWSVSVGSSQIVRWEGPVKVLKQAHCCVSLENGGISVAVTGRGWVEKWRLS